MYIYGINNKEFLLLPFCGILILIINSQGFPNKNFDPTTGDLFKVHYYSFLVSISFVFLLIYFYKKFNYTQYLSLLLIPMFLATMGFPKNLSDENLNGVLSKLEYTSICSFVDNIYNAECK